jgi:hypothetical protein
MRHLNPNGVVSSLRGEPTQPRWGCGYWIGTISQGRRSFLAPTLGYGIEPLRGNKKTPC